MPASLSSAVGDLRDMCGRALEKLSRDLYSNESQFFQELLQNSDDCRYRAGTEPTLSVSVTADAVLLHTNEEGKQSNPY